MNLDRICYGCFEEKDGPFCGNCGFHSKFAAQYPQALPLGTILGGRYITGKVLEVDSFAISYLSYELVLEIKVVIREYFPSRLAERGGDHYAVITSAGEEETFRTGRQRFLDEARALAGIQSMPGIASVRNQFEENNTAYIVADYKEEPVRAANSPAADAANTNASMNVPAESAAPKTLYVPAGSSATKPLFFTELLANKKRTALLIGAGALVILLAVGLPLLLKGGGNTEHSETSEALAPKLTSMPTASPEPTPEPAPVLLFPDGQAYSEPHIGVTLRAPKDFEITSGGRTVFMKRGDCTSIAVSFSYNEEYPCYSVEEYVAHLDENLKNDYTATSKETEMEILDGSYVTIGETRAYRASIKFGDGAQLRAESYIMPPNEGQGVYIVHVLQKTDVPDAAQYWRDNEDILRSLILTGGENCGLTVFEGRDIPIKFAYDNTYFESVEETPAQDGKVANIKLYPRQEERHPIFIEDAGGFADSAEDFFSVYYDIMKNDEDFEMGEQKTKHWGLTYQTKAYQRRIDGKLLLGMCGVTEINGRLCSLDINEAEEAAEEALDYYVQLLGTLTAK